MYNFISSPSCDFFPLFFSFFLLEAGRADLALLAVQVELVLADGHGPDGLDEGRAGVPRVHRDAAVAKRPPCHRRPTVGADTRPPYTH